MVSSIGWFETLEISQELEKLGVKVFIIDYEEEVKDIKEAERLELSNVYIGWRIKSRLPTYVFSIPRLIKKLRPHVVHVHHEYLLFGRPFVSLFFPLLLLLIKLTSRRPLVVTIHSIIPMEKVRSTSKRFGMPRLLAKLGFLLMNKLIFKFADAVTVASRLCKKVLSRQYGMPEDKMVIIPHQAVKKWEKKEDTLALKRKLGFDDRRVLATFGIVRKSKRFELVIEAVGELVKDMQDLLLIITGSIRPPLTEEGYIDMLHALVKEKGIEDNVRFIIRPYVEDGLLYQILWASDVICLTYEELGVLASSGALAEIIMMMKPVVVTDILKFKEYRWLKDILVFYSDGSVEGTVEAIRKALSASARIDEKLVRSRLKRLFPESIARRLKMLYSQLLVKRRM